MSRPPGGDAVSLDAHVRSVVEIDVRAEVVPDRVPGDGDVVADHGVDALAEVFVDLVIADRH
jgi:hypothetical protein